MDITPRIVAQSSIIQSYAQGRFKISGTVFDSPVIVTPLTAISWSHVDVGAADAVTAIQSAIAALKAPAEILLIGTGAALPSVLPAWVRQGRSHFGCAVDIMDTPAACRTFNVLQTEGRGVVALLMPV
ncbi:MAG: Mth938-like domain-containing protein [Pseudomonadota bacterium]